MQATPPAPTILSETVRRALAEDIDRGDITTEACVEPTAAGVATLSARERIVAMLTEVFERRRRDPDAKRELFDILLTLEDEAGEPRREHGITVGDAAYCIGQVGR